MLKKKTHDFWAPLASGILQRNVDSKDSIMKKMELPEKHPKKIARSIAMKETTATEDIFKQSLSRFGNPNYKLYLTIINSSIMKQNNIKIF